MLTTSDRCVSIAGLLLNDIVRPREDDMRIERNNQRDMVMHMQALMGEITDEMLGDSTWDTSRVDVTLRELKEAIDTYHQER